MTMDNTTPGNEPAGISLRVFVVVVLLVVIGAATAIWFAIPGPDTSHRIVSPSGLRAIELAEICGANGCTRVALLDATQPDGSHVRTFCPLERAGLTPLFAQVTATWSAGEDSVTLDYVASSGPTGSFAITLTSCTGTE